MSSKIPFPKRVVEAKRRLVGSSTDMYSSMSEFLEQPEGKRSRARRATFKGKPNKDKMESLCNELNDTMYRDDLYKLAIDLGIDVYKNVTKAELCKVLSEYAQEIPMPTVLDITETSSKMGKVLPLNLMDFARKYSNGRDEKDYLIIATEMRQNLDNITEKDLEHYPSYKEETNKTQEVRNEFTRIVIKDMVFGYLPWPSFIDPGASGC